MQRRVKARYKHLLGEDGQQRVDAATALAAVGRLRSGGTAAGDSSPSQSQITRFVSMFQVGRTFFWSGFLLNEGTSTEEAPDRVRPATGGVAAP